MKLLLAVKFSFAFESDETNRFQAKQLIPICFTAKSADKLQMQPHSTHP